MLGECRSVCWLGHLWAHSPRSSVRDCRSSATRYTQTHMLGPAHMAVAFQRAQGKAAAERAGRCRTVMWPACTSTSKQAPAACWNKARAALGFRTRTRGNVCVRLSAGCRQLLAPSAACPVVAADAAASVHPCGAPLSPVSHGSPAAPLCHLCHMDHLLSPFATCATWITCCAPLLPVPHRSPAMPLRRLCHMDHLLCPFVARATHIHLLPDP